MHQVPCTRYRVNEFEGRYTVDCRIVVVVVVVGIDPTVVALLVGTIRGSEVECTPPPPERNVQNVALLWAVSVCVYTL